MTDKSETALEALDLNAIPALLNRPDVARHLDRSAPYDVTVTRLRRANDDFLIITQVGEIDSDRFVLHRGAERYELYDGDIGQLTNTGSPEPKIAMERMAAPISFWPSNAEDHRAVYQFVIDNVDRYDSASGPDGGNLACLWVVRRIVHAVLGRTITTSDATKVFGRELSTGFNQRLFDQADVPAGGIIISPTVGGNVGHVGFLGQVLADQDERLIFSNSSRRHRLEQNWTVASWRAHYAGSNKNLDVLFYPLPTTEPPTPQASYTVSRNTVLRETPDPRGVEVGDLTAGLVQLRVVSPAQNGWTRVAVIIPGIPAMTGPVGFVESGLLIAVANIA